MPRIILHVATTSNGCRILCVGTKNTQATGLQPRKSRAEKRIIGEYALLDSSKNEWADIQQQSMTSNGAKLKRRLFSLFGSCARQSYPTSCVPVLNDVRYVTMDQLSNVVLVSYGDKVSFAYYNTSLPRN